MKHLLFGLITAAMLAGSVAPANANHINGLHLKCWFVHHHHKICRWIHR